jgi:hypothetical protein
MFPYFKRLKEHHKNLFILLIATSAVLFWRSVWGIADELLFPNNYMLSSVTSLTIAIVIFLAAHYSFRNIF